ncbi:hypothetical protein M231_04938 [Tremella mesenterica]|uniref:Uncharacterized protein n=1 Tax=Tremella mesenterica TaxID=5217 RepID=A0A4Q1BJI2_TREME|nr:hypothetical protein M231_04938 [Tremella mesenterica]
MEDPWAAGPSWATPKPLNSQDTLPAPSTSPAPALDHADPWARPTVIPPSTSPVHSPIPQSGSPPLKSPTYVPESNWGGEWGKEEEDISVPGLVEVTPQNLKDDQDVATEKEEPEVTVPLPRQTEDNQAIWTLNSPNIDSTSLPPPPPPEENTSLPVPSTPPKIDIIPQAPFSSSSHHSHLSHTPSLSIHSPHSSTSRHTPYHEQRDGIPSPRPGSDFGGFTDINAADPWGGDWGVGETGHSRTNSGFVTPEIQNVDDDNHEGWGGVPVRSNSVIPRKEDDEWEEAQRRILMREQRAPQVKIVELQKEWRELVEGVIGLDKLPVLTEEEQRKLDQTIRQTDDDVHETLRSLSVIPPNINTYPPVISSLTTHQSLLSALQRPNPTPQTSLLNITMARRSRHKESFGDADSPWGGRSRLGEPEVPVLEAVTNDEPQKKGWSFWGRKNTQDKPLVTSGGGVLEVKTVDGGTTSLAQGNSRPESPANNPLQPDIIPEASFSAIQTLAPIQQIPSGPVNSIESTPTAQATSTAKTTPTVQPPQNAQNAQGSQPSALGRFFGRIRRQPSGSGLSKEIDPKDIDPKDIELSADDFTFLDQVPSLSSPPQEKGVGALLSLEPSQSIKGIQDILANKNTSLPQPLAPPPRPNSRLSFTTISEFKESTTTYGTLGNTSISGSNGRNAPIGRIGNNDNTSNPKFVARMTSQPIPKSDIDLLGGLDFTDSPISPNTGSSTWDEFLSPGTSIPRISTPPVIPRLSSPPTVNVSPQITGSSINTFSSPSMIQRSITPSSVISFTSVPLQPSPIRQSPKKESPTPVPPTLNNHTLLSSPDGVVSSKSSGLVPAPIIVAGPSSHNHFASDDFGDFGDFSSFDSSLPSMTPHTFSSPSKTQSQLLPQSLSQIHIHPSPVPHRPPHLGTSNSLTQTLVNDAIAVKGRRWPAPPSPIAPMIEPPPGSNTKPTGGFPFLSPPGSGTISTGFPFLPPPSQPVPKNQVDLLNHTSDQTSLVGEYGIPSTSQMKTSLRMQGVMEGLVPTPKTTHGELGGSNVNLGTRGVGSRSGLEQEEKKDMTETKGLSAQDLSFFDSL